LARTVRSAVVQARGLGAGGDVFGPSITRGRVSVERSICFGVVQVHSSRVAGIGAATLLRTRVRSSRGVGQARAAAAIDGCGPVERVVAEGVGVLALEGEAQAIGLQRPGKAWPIGHLVDHEIGNSLETVHQLWGIGTLESQFLASVVQARCIRPHHQNFGRHLMRETKGMGVIAHHQQHVAGAQYEIR
jgi:hypothetical protein